MRTHAKIIEDGGGYQAVASKVPNTIAARVRFWAKRSSIPPEFWTGFVGAGLCSLEELAAAAAANPRALPKRKRLSQPGAAAA